MRISISSKWSTQLCIWVTQLGGRDNHMKQSYELLIAQVPSLKLALENEDANSLELLYNNVSLLNIVVQILCLQTILESYRKERME